MIGPNDDVTNIESFIKSEDQPCRQVSSSVNICEHDSSILVAIGFEALVNADTITTVIASIRSEFANSSMRNRVIVWNEPPTDL